MKILIIVDHYLPGTKAGGPIQSVSNFVECFKLTHEIFLFTRDRDLGDTTPFREIKCNQWNEVAGVLVYYASPENCNLKFIRSVLHFVQPDLVYLNSILSPLSRLVFFDMLWSKRTKQIILLAVRGELNIGALKHKPIRKWIYLRLMRLLKLEERITFQASSKYEAIAIRSQFPLASSLTAGPIPKKAVASNGAANPKHLVTFVFAARISRMKNLNFLLDRFAALKDLNWRLEIYGVIEDKGYWNECLKVIGPLGKKVQYFGEFRPEQITEIYGRADYMVLPSLGENFGHSIYESASVGLPFLISDRTPWDTEKCANAGIVIPLESPVLWEQEIANCMVRDSFQWQIMRKNCIELAASVYKEAVDANKIMLATLATECGHLSIVDKDKVYPI